MVSRISELDALAKMNLPDERCYQVYKAMIEPNIKSMIESYFKDWQNIEMQVTSMVMKLKDIFTTSQIVTSMGERNQDFSLVKDAKQFHKIKRTNFSVKLECLLVNGIISPKMYDLLMHLAKRRNKIHEYNGIFTEDDRILSAAGASLLHPTYLSTCFPSERDVWQYSIELNDKAAAQLLKTIGDWESSGQAGPMMNDSLDIQRVKGGWELNKSGS